MEVTAESLVFLVLSALTLGGGLLVVTTRNLFHAGLYLMLCLFGIAGLFALLAAPFLAGVQVVVYIGAIAILIVVAVMLTPEVTKVKRGHNDQWIAGIVAATLFFVLLLAVITPLMDELGADNFNADFTQEDPADVPGGTVTQIGKDLVDPHGFMVPFELASVLLMAAMIGAVVIVWPRRDDDESEAETGAVSAPPLVQAAESGED